MKRKAELELRASDLGLRMLPTGDELLKLVDAVQSATATERDRKPMAKMALPFEECEQDVA